MTLPYLAIVDIFTRFDVLLAKALLCYSVVTALLWRFCHMQKYDFCESLVNNCIPQSLVHTA